MFCRKCGMQIPDGSRFCPNCGTQNEAERLDQKGSFLERLPVQKPAVMAGIVLFLLFVLFAGIWLGRRADRQEEPSQNPSASSEEETEEASLIGVWKCERGEVTFTDNGHMMMGQNGIVFGGGWVQYEVVDDTTLYLSGGDIPVGINIDYELDGDYLTLEINGMPLLLSREK